MKISITIFVFLFSSFSFADSIKNFQIEGISIGDSLLNFYSKNEILKNQLDIYNDKSFKVSRFTNQSLINFDSLLIHYKNNENNFIIESIDGTIPYVNNMVKCNSKKNQIASEIKELFKNQNWETSEYEDADGIFISEYLVLPSGASIGIQCYDWNNRIETEYNFYDHLRLSLSSKEFQYWIDYVEDNLVN